MNTTQQTRVAKVRNASGKWEIVVTKADLQTNWNPVHWVGRAFNPALTFLGGMVGGWFTNADTSGPQVNTPDGTQDFGLESRALQVTTVWACIRRITEIIGTLSIGIYERTPSGRRVVRDHPLWYVLNVAPNAVNTPVELLESWAMNLAIDGNCYSRVIRNGVKDVIALHPMASQQMAVFEDPDSGMPAYRYAKDGRQIPYTQEQIWQARLFGNGLKGLSPLAYARLAVANAWTGQNNALQFNAKGGKPAGVLMIDHVLKPDQRTAVRSNFADLEAGGDAASRLFVLEAGMKYQQLSISPADAQMIEQLQFSVDDICRVFCIPSHLVNSQNKGTVWGSGIEQLDIGFLKYTIQPYLTRIESAINRWLIPPSEADRIYAEFNIDSLLRADSAARASFYSTMVQNGLMSRNEVRTKENLDTREGADDLTVQVNLTPIQDLPPATSATATSNQAE